jgi:hypothetical protein
MIKQKRGAAVLTLFRSAELVLFGVAILCLLMIGFRLTETTYEKNFIARDMALFIDTIYASPGDLEYVYDLGTFHSRGYKFDLEIKDSKVIVYDSGYEKPQGYRFAEKEDYDIDDFKAEAPRAVKFVKKSHKISMEALY